LAFGSIAVVVESRYFSLQGGIAEKMYQEGNGLGLLNIGDCKEMDYSFTYYVYIYSFVL